MNCSENILSSSTSPIDRVANLFSAQTFDVQRRSNNEIAVEVQGKWNNMVLFFTWENNMQCLHLSCIMDIAVNVEDKNKIFELLALTNQDLWLGHFAYWTEQNMIMFKHSSILDCRESNFDLKVRHLTDIAIKECERMYPIFKAVLTKGMSPKQALYPMLMETFGNA